jgi:hypothetical protein
MTEELRVEHKAGNNMSLWKRQLITKQNRKGLWMNFFDIFMCYWRTERKCGIKQTNGPFSWVHIGWAHFITFVLWQCNEHKRDEYCATSIMLQASELEMVGILSRYIRKGIVFITSAVT